MDWTHKHYFVTGTDTGIGKTYVTAQLMRQLKAEGKTVLGLKPLASGAIDGKNEDALIYLEENSLALPYTIINPFCFPEACSPHIAARLNHCALTSQGIVSQMQEGLNQDVDHVFIEGAGGVHAPISENETMLDLMRAFDVPVILVVGLRLGCLNHALLSMQALQAAGLKIAGWVPNLIDPTMEYIKENIELLDQRLPSRL
jgi:dethiobiotin synthetase